MVKAVNTIPWKDHLVKKIINYTRLTRLHNNLITVCSVLVGAVVSGNFLSREKVLFACLSAFFISAGGNVINDFFDIEIDRINKPNRPLPRGVISPKSALIFSLLLFLMGLFLSIGVRPPSCIFALVACGLLVAYSYALKRTLIWGNLTVSVIAALAFIYGGIATEDFRLSLIPAAFALLFHLGREILKDIEDMKGDASAGAATLPVKLGVKFSVNICTLVFVSLIILTTLPYFFHLFSFLYLIVAVLGVDLVLIYVIWSLEGNHSPSNLHRLSNILKIDMLIGLLAILLGRI
jgi:geranylgeranylglycerol-phosphate geranylgeranyltransferase